MEFEFLAAIMYVMDVYFAFVTLHVVVFVLSIVCLWYVAGVLRSKITWQTAMAFIGGVAVCGVAVFSFVPLCEREGKMETCFETLAHLVIGSW